MQESDMHYEKHAHQISVRNLFPVLYEYIHCLQLFPSLSIRLIVVFLEISSLIRNMFPVNFWHASMNALAGNCSGKKIGPTLLPWHMILYETSIFSIFVSSHLAFFQFKIFPPVSLFLKNHIFKRWLILSYFPFFLTWKKSRKIFSILSNFYLWLQDVHSIISGFESL